MALLIALFSGLESAYAAYKTVEAFAVPTF
jgi:hypothetical protein